MAIIDLNPTPPTPPTADQIRQYQALRMQADIAAQWQAMQSVFNTVASYIWGSTEHTPQQALDAFGTNAADLFNLSNAYLGMIAAYTGQAVTSPVPTGWKYTINQDGTVSVTQG